MTIIKNVAKTFLTASHSSLHNLVYSDSSANEGTRSHNWSHRNVIL